MYRHIERARNRAASFVSTYYDDLSPEERIIWSTEIKALADCQFRQRKRDIAENWTASRPTATELLRRRIMERLTQ